MRGLQNELNARGFQAGTADGISGSKTQAAVKALQKAGGIAADGIVGPDTWAALYAGTPGGAQPASAHFKASEFKCHDGTEVPAKFYANLQKLMALLEQIRTACGGRAVIINSGYRTAAYNKKVGGAPLSQHLLAKAADIRVEGMTAKQVYDIANRLNPNGGVGKYASFTHVDVRDGRARW
ncbi:MAG: D-Ala-D-Ala carboxypeptidase family metallohydrolase [Christensenellales bacterium]